MKRFILISLLAVLFVLPVRAQQGISPCSAATLNVSNVSSNVQLASCGQTVLLWNVGANEAFYKYGTSSGTAATTADWSIPSTSFVVLNLGTNRPYLAAITSSSTT